MATREPVTVIGLGPMGTAMAESLLAAGHPTTVWNRTASKAEPLVARGATQAASPEEALRAGELVVISLIDYAAMYAVLTTAEGALAGRVLVNLSSGSPEELRRAGDWAAGHGAQLVTGGIMTPPPGVGKTGAYVFYSGPEAPLRAHEEALAALGRVDHMGTDPGLSMLYYQAMLTLFTGTLVSHMYASALIASGGDQPEALYPYAAEMVTGLAEEGPMGYLRIVTEEVQARSYSGEENSLHMQAAGARHVEQAYAEAGLDAELPRAIRQLFERAVDAGLGHRSLTASYEVIEKPEPRPAG
ncbi:NAD(P)-dependent oxidoreductase [Streptomyces profundus]|uniref:NAD(P)-dependent oxidoreductase n=1 Tax=Streptomyces profundus TaxID=2867410 RepID=UPI001D1686C2|nr:NAD(P)-binding domain-containing protein [Streptomyces sp. MA3_2.13]UED83633.1 NAD(P)-binding domain-containing protein [Streptomyces sp. MA3_2.13]